MGRLNFFGIDDELNAEPSSYYNTKFKLFNNTELNTKLLRFRINNLRDLKLSQNAKLILESCYIPTVIETGLDIKHNSNVILKFKNVSDVMILLMIIMGLQSFFHIQYNHDHNQLYL